MRNILPSNHFRCIHQAKTAIVLSIGLAAAGAAVSAHAQGEIPSGTISGSGSGPYTYNLTFSDSASATSPIGSVWYAWTSVVSPFFYLPGTPTSASGPAGWTGSVVGNSIQFVASSAANDIQPGSSLSGFSYHATFSPAQLAAAANSGLSVAYSGAIEGPGDPSGKQFTVLVAPEPGTVALLVAGVGVWAVGRRRSSAGL